MCLQAATLCPRADTSKGYVEPHDSTEKLPRNSRKNPGMWRRGLRAPSLPVPKGGDCHAFRLQRRAQPRLFGSARSAFCRGTNSAPNTVLTPVCKVFTEPFACQAQLSPCPAAVDEITGASFLPPNTQGSPSSAHAGAHRRHSPRLGRHSHVVPSFFKETAGAGSIVGRLCSWRHAAFGIRTTHWDKAGYAFLGLDGPAQWSPNGQARFRLKEAPRAIGIGGNGAASRSESTGLRVRPLCYGDSPGFVGQADDHARRQGGSDPGAGQSTAL